MFKKIHRNLYYYRKHITRKKSSKRRKMHRREKISSKKKKNSSEGKREEKIIDCIIMLIRENIHKIGCMKIDFYCSSGEKCENFRNLMYCTMKNGEYHTTAYKKWGENRKIKTKKTTAPICGSLHSNGNIGKGCKLKVKFREWKKKSVVVICYCSAQKYSVCVTILRYLNHFSSKWTGIDCIKCSWPNNFFLIWKISLKARK